MSSSEQPRQGASRRGPEKLGNILRDFLETSGLGHRLKHLELHGAWEEVVGPAVAAHTRILGFAHHKLYVEVDSAARRHELSSFHKKAVLEALRCRLPNLLIQDIAFRPPTLGRT